MLRGGLLSIAWGLAPRNLINNRGEDMPFWKPQASGNQCMQVFSVWDCKFRQERSGTRILFSKRSPKNSPVIFLGQDSPERTGWLYIIDGEKMYCSRYWRYVSHQQSFRMPASKLSVQLELRYNWRISMLKVLHGGILLCARAFHDESWLSFPPSQVCFAGTNKVCNEKFVGQEASYLC